MTQYNSEVNLKVGVDTNEAENEVKSLSEQFGELEDKLRELASQGKQNTQEFKDLASRAGELQRSMESATKAIDAAAHGSMGLQKVVDSALALSSGFSMVEGTMALFGSESEELAKTMQKVQGAMAITMGLKELSELMKTGALSTTIFGKAFQALTGSTNGATTATKGFSKALTATGIGAIVTAIGLLIANWDDLKEIVSATNYEMEATTEAVKDIGKEFAKERGEVEKLAYEYKQVNTSAQRKKEIIEKLQEISPNYFKTLNKEKTSVDELTTAQTKFNEALMKQALLKGYQKQLEELASKQAQVNTELETGTREASWWQKSLNFIATSVSGMPSVTSDVLNNIDAVKGANKELEQNQKQIDAVLKLINKTETELNKMGGVAIEEAPKKVDKAAKVVRQSAMESMASLDMLQSKFAEVVKKSQEDVNKIRATDMVASQNELVKTSLDGQLEMFNQYQSNYNHSFDEMIQSQRDALTKGLIDYKTYTENIAKIDALRVQGQRDTAKAVSDVMSALSETFGQETKAGKILASASALINTYLGITEVLKAKNPYPEPFGTAVKAASATAIAIQGFNAVRNINKVQVPGGGAGLQPPSTPSPFKPSSGATTGSSVLSSQMTAETVKFGKQLEVKTYVLESDISATQKRTSTIRKTATLQR